MATDLLHHPARPPRIPAVARILSQFDRPKLEGFITVAISLLDVMDGDTDIEPDDAEDSFAFSALAQRIVKNWGPGCPISDPGDDAWIEWSTMGWSQKRGPNIICRFGEDAEDDDGGGDCTDDEPGFDALSRAQANLLGFDAGPGCPIADPDYGAEEAGEVDDGQ